jgi:hypothetical protein
VNGGFNGDWQAAENQHVSFTFYTRHTAYKKPVPSSVEHRDLMAPGGSVQYELDSGHDRMKNRFSAGLDLDGQWVLDLRHPNTTYGLLNARFSKTWQHRGVYGTFFVAAKNLTGRRYIAFTEPDPDGNSYHPGSNREFFGGLQVRF